MITASTEFSRPTADLPVSADSQARCKLIEYSFSRSIQFSLLVLSVLMLDCSVRTMLPRKDILVCIPIKY